MPKVSGGAAGTGEWATFFMGDEPLKYAVDIYARCPRVGPSREVTEIYLKARPGHRIDARLLRDFNIESIRRFANFTLDRQLEAHAGESPDYAELIKSEHFLSGQRKVRNKGVQVDASVDVPPGRDRSPEFYEQIADLFKRLAVTDPRPAATIAKFNKLPLPTVHGWIKVARDRGLLEPGRRRKK
jgi:hypothetical protein